MSNSESQNENPQSLDTAALKKFAQAARVQLLGVVESKLDRVLADDSLSRRESAKAVSVLESQIEDSSREQVIEQVAYTWFNRFCALRFMDVNRYTKLGTVSPADGFSQPEILADAKQGVIDDDWKVDKSEILGLLDGSRPSDDPQEEAYQRLVIGVCNNLNAVMPKMFQKIADYTELLIPDDLLSDSSILTATREALTSEACQNVEVIGWLYQFYISEKKDDVFAALKKGKKIIPENIPAATQLFTPHWIVRYLVENSLGRLWMLNHPDSKLVEQMDYYIRPEEPETDFLRTSSPEEIKICDPACGSGHMLTYAFDLLYAIYEEQGYQATDIPRLILTHNLYGIEIDQRAGALAAFALTMKAREKYRRFLTGGKVVQPNICVLENISIDPEDLDAYLAQVGRDLFSGGLQGVVNQWEEADNFGSLIRPLVTDVSEVLELLRERQLGEDLFLAGVHQKVLTALRQADYLSPKYHVVVANPPYMGGGGLNARLKPFLSDNYEDGKSDVFAAFMLRATSLTLDKSLVGMVCPFVWMFIASYEDLRDKLLSSTTIESLVRLEYNAFEPACIPVCVFVISKAVDTSRPGVFIDLSEFKGAENQAPRTLAAIEDPECEWRFTAAADDFNRIPTRPVVYWLEDGFLEAFERNPSVSSFGNTRKGMATGLNERFVRQWHEVSFARVGFCMTRDEAEKSDAKWFPYANGGGFRKWYGHYSDVVNWENDGSRLQTEKHESGRLRAVNLNLDYIFREGISWTSITSGKLSMRQMPSGFLFSSASNAFFGNQSGISNQALLCLLNSKLSELFTAALNPTLNANPGDIARIPVPEEAMKSPTVADRYFRIEEICKSDWDSRETSWDFSTPSLELCDGSVSDAFQTTRDVFRRRTTSLQELEGENNEHLAAAFRVNDYVDCNVPLEEVTLFGNPLYRYDADKSESELEALLLADTMREFISYAVGCMLGRYSLDKPGLILANQGETADNYRQQIPEPTFAPDEDNVIPLLDGDWFTDDISERFKEFLKVTFGTEHYEENLTFLENSLYPANLEGKKRKDIRNYFLKDFYNHHIKMYKKRPIYWMFSSPKGTFNALVYMHRYQSDTVSVILNDYLREFMTKLRSKIEALQQLADSGDSAKTEKTKALKEITKLNKQLKELEDYDRDVLYPLATEQVEIDLDDGVKVNYNKFGSALKKVTGLTGKA